LGRKYWKLSSAGREYVKALCKELKWESLGNTEICETLRETMNFGIDRGTLAKFLDPDSKRGCNRHKLEGLINALGSTEDPTTKAFSQKYFEQIKSYSIAEPEEELEVSTIEPLVKADNLGEFGNPFQPLNGRIEKSEQFFNREKELRDIFEILNAGSGVELLGDRRMGKSSLLQQIRYRAASELTGQWEAVYLNLQKIHSEAEFYESFCEELDIANCIGIELNRSMKSKRVLLLLDETENLQGNGFTREIRDRLRAFAEDGSLRLVVATCMPLDHLFPDSDERGMTSPFQGICLRVELKPWQEETVRKFVVTRLENTGISFTKADMEKLWRESQGHPQKLMKACFDLYRQYCENL